MTCETLEIILAIGVAIFMSAVGVAVMIIVSEEVAKELVEDAKSTNN